MTHPPKLPPKDVWDRYRRDVLGITDADQRGYILKLKRRQKEKRRD